MLPLRFASQTVRLYVFTAFVIIVAALSCRADGQDDSTGARADLAPLIHGKPFEFWVKALKDRKDEEAAHAAEVLGELGSRAVEALPALCRASGQGYSEKVNEAARAALLRIDPDATYRLKIALAGLKNVNPHVREGAVASLADLKDSYPKQVLDGIIEALHDQADDVREEAAFVLTDFGPKAVKAVPALIDALSDKDEDVRQSAADALGEIGPAAKPAFIPLCRALKDDKDIVRLSVASALIAIGDTSKAGTAILIDDLKVEDVGARIYSARVLISLKVNETAALRTLTDLLASEDFFLRCHVAGELGRIGPAAKAAIPALRQAMTDDLEEVREAAAEALKKIDPETTNHTRDSR